MPLWRNGRRGRFKIFYPLGCTGSNPVRGTIRVWDIGCPLALGARSSQFDSDHFDQTLVIKFKCPCGGTVDSGDLESPVCKTCRFKSCHGYHASVAQLVEAAVSKTAGCGFDSHLKHQSSLKIMPEWWNGIHAGLRSQYRKVCRFKSCLGHHMLS